jgi:hypothetical protein
MKLRIRDNAIRLRLTQGEVATLAKDGRLAAQTAFPEARRFGYAIESSPTVRLPESAVLAWAASEQVSIAGEQRLDDGALLTLLVEKDFACLAPRPGEDESDTFPHPEADAGRC